MTQQSEDSQIPAFWNVKVYDDEGRERETIRGVTVARKDTLMKIFDREGIQAQAMGFDEEGSSMLDSESVNWGRSL